MQMKKPRAFVKAILSVFILGGLIFPCTAFAGTPETLAVLSFDINADKNKNLDYLKKGISTMLYSRLTSPGKVVVVPPQKMASLEAGLKKLSGSQLVHETARKTDSRYVIHGTITSLAGAFSIDAKVFDTTEKQYMAFFEQSKNSDDLIQKVDRIAAAINHKVFNRTTVTWEQMEQEKQKKINELKNQNPENLMQMPTGWQQEEKVGWKVWKYLF
jgi:TolB-like protein